MSGIEARAVPGGRVRLTFGPKGYAAEPVKLSDRVTHWAGLVFRDKNLLIALGVTVPLSVPAILFGNLPAPIGGLAIAPVMISFGFLVLGLLLRVAAEAVLTLLGAVLFPVVLVYLLIRWRKAGRGFVPTADIRGVHPTPDGLMVVLSGGRQVGYAMRPEARDRAARAFTELAG